MKILPALFPLTLTFAAPAFAAQQDGQAWGAATASIAAGDKVVIWLEGQTRFFDDASRLGQRLLRTGVGHRIAKTDTAFLGYAHLLTRPAGRGSTSEHRIWQQLSLGIAGDGKGPTLTSRTRLEQRFLDEAGGTNLRLRQLLRLTAPIIGPVRGVGWSETFLRLNSTGWAGDAGFDRIRNFVGFALTVGRHVSVEPGYMNEYVRQPGADRSNHIASLTLNSSF